MTVRTTLSFTDRHHRFLQAKVEEGIFASTSAAVASAVEAMMAENAAHEAALGAMAEAIRARMALEDHLALDEVMGEARARLARRRDEAGPEQA